MRGLLLSSLLVTVALAGCFGSGDTDDGPDIPAPPAATHELLPVEEVWVPSTVDGKRMHNAVYRPATDDPVGVFINFSPYWGDSATAEGDPFSHYMIHEYVPRGFAVVLSAVRGTGHSGGCFQIAGDVELQDTRDVIDFFAAEPWSNGRVAAGGKSYDSTTQNGVIAKFPTDALAGIFHVSGISDMYRYNYRNGVVYGPTQGTLFNTLYYGQGLHEYGLPSVGSPGGAASMDDEDADSLARAIDDAACTELPEIQAHGVGAAAVGTKTDYWVERDWNRFIPDTPWRGNVFFVHGLQDWNVKPDHILPWLDLLPEDIPRRVWLHQDTENLGHVYPMRDDWNATMLAWMDHTLNGVDNGFFDGPAHQVQGTDGLWRSSDAWPAAGPETTFDTTPEGITLTGPLRITGAPVLQVPAMALTADPVLSAVMEKDGQWVNEAVLRVLYRNGLEAPAPVEPGTVLDLQVAFYPMDLVLGDGESLTITFQATPEMAYPLPGQLDGLTVGPGTFLARLGPLDADPVQPTPIACFAC